ncbi:hypothetical protein AVEN_165075-1 [Araneus ventricosus]|uniref:Uncharacterized protein n=1 Tax=Araneus ventricosus TaxID=182803 RepID=A0A4Y2F6J7_ARAVE|nr:hypothetical protein AVEN_165075-1 [Araneus ventricosus]
MRCVHRNRKLALNEKFAGFNPLGQHGYEFGIVQAVIDWRQILWRFTGEQILWDMVDLVNVYCAGGSAPCSLKFAKPQEDCYANPARFARYSEDISHPSTIVKS